MVTPIKTWSWIRFLPDPLVPGVFKLCLGYRTLGPICCVYFTPFDCFTELFVMFAQATSFRRRKSTPCSCSTWCPSPASASWPWRPWPWRTGLCWSGRCITTAASGFSSSSAAWARSCTTWPAAASSPSPPPSPSTSWATWTWWATCCCPRCFSAASCPRSAAQAPRWPCQACSFIRTRSLSSATWTPARSTLRGQAVFTPPAGRTWTNATRLTQRFGSRDCRTKTS